MTFELVKKGTPVIREDHTIARIDKVSYYLGMAEQAALRSTCLRRAYGAVIVKNDEVIATGYNGSARGEENCSDRGYCEREALQIPKGERYELCLSGDTVIMMVDEDNMTIRELVESGRKDLLIQAVDTGKSRVVTAMGCLPRVTGHVTSLLEIMFSNGTSLKCTHNHKIMLDDNTYVEACELSEGDQLATLKGGNKIKVASVSEIACDEDVYDLTVPVFENFAIDLGSGDCIFVHNCVAIHAEQNAIISASRKDMVGATMYIAGREVATGEFADGRPCLLCSRMLKNSGIEKVIYRGPDGNPIETAVTDL